MVEVRPRVGVSGCLLGSPVRYNGGHSRCRFLTDELAEYVQWAQTCPEAEIGLGVPRPMVRLLSDGRLVAKDGPADHSRAVAELAERSSPGWGELDGFVVKARSPSCGLFGVPRYSAGLPGERTDGQPVDHRGRGAFTAALTAACPDLPVEEDGRLNDPGLREHFVERLFAHARLRGLLSGGWSAGDLVAFHSRHELQIMAHDPQGCRESGGIVARAGASREETARQYRRVFARALAVRPSRGRHVDALQHVFGLLSARLNRPCRLDLLETISAFEAGLVPLSLPVALLRHHAVSRELPYVAGQTYLDPYPRELRLRHYL
ncbi:DUF523 and DUF1722 domain-containing protein [Actinocorallia sp. B10E7]|uniref:YbgA family protein n=1 Tax=Actinocorallia sp. B10E7 TaxID=3153558 RepID=UPI00325CF325